MTAPLVGDDRGLVARLKAELRFLVGSAWRALWRSALICWGLAFVFVLIAIFNSEPPEGRPGDMASDFVAMLMVSVGYSAYLAFFPASIVAAFWFAAKLVGPWVILPVLAIPSALVVVLWAFSGLLAGEANEIWEALAEAAKQHEWVALAIGPFARAGPVALVIALPLLVIDLGILALQPAVLWEIFTFAAWAAFAVALAVLPSAGMSLVVLSVAYVRRLTARHRA